MSPRQSDYSTENTSQKLKQTFSPTMIRSSSNLDKVVDRQQMVPPIQKVLPDQTKMRDLERVAKSHERLPQRYEDNDVLSREIQNSQMKQQRQSYQNPDFKSPLHNGPGSDVSVPFNFASDDMSDLRSSQYSQMPPQFSAARRSKNSQSQLWNAGQSILSSQGHNSFGRKQSQESNINQVTVRI